jgi:plastocyanin
MRIKQLMRRTMGCRVATVLGAGAACGKTSSAPSTTPASETVTIAVTSAGATPKNVTVKPGSQVTFTNNDTVQHQMFSDPHPEHTDCPELDTVGVLAPGQSRQSENLNTVRTCGFHDHIHFENESLKGSITIQ